MESGVVAQYYNTFASDGLDNITKANMIVYWPSTDSSMTNNRTFDSHMTLKISLEDLTGDNLIFNVLEVGLNRDHCPPGTGYDPLSRTCTICLSSQYGAWNFLPDQ